MNPFEKQIFIPKLGENLVVDLPNERIQSVVVRVPDDDTAVVEIIVAPMGKVHRYRKGDLVPVRRRITPFGETWVAVDERQLALAANMRAFEKDQAEREAAAAVKAAADLAVREQELLDAPDDVGEPVVEKPAKRKRAG